MRYEIRKVEIGASNFLHLLRTVRVLHDRVMDDVYLVDHHYNVLAQSVSYVEHMIRMVEDAAYATDPTAWIVSPAPEARVGEGLHPSYGSDELSDSDVHADSE